ncbi:uncharacterized protein C18orf19 homolog A [Anopheles ziemanni]|nr:uncharacterized protein C18orf19 homolog A [Anopheles ziemanni]
MYTSSPVKLINLAQRYHCSSAFTRPASSGTLQVPWRYCNDRYSTKYLAPSSIPFKGVPVRTLSIGDWRYLQKRDLPNEQESIASPSSAPVPPEKLGLFARFKKMYKEYWYVLVPVHCLTSVMWFGGFYYASTSGVDVIAILESMGVSETLINPVRDSSLGHIAIAYLLYKIATPARYTVTLGGTTVSIKYLEQWGYIKPMPNKAQLVQMYKDKKENIQERIAEKRLDFQEKMAEKKLDIQEKIAVKKQDFQDRKQQLTEKKNTLMNDIKSIDTSVKSPTEPAASSVTESK